MSVAQTIQTLTSMQQFNKMITMIICNNKKNTIKTMQIITQQFNKIEIKYSANMPKIWLVVQNNFATKSAIFNVSRQNVADLEYIRKNLTIFELN